MSFWANVSGQMALGKRRMGKCRITISESLQQCSSSWSRTARRIEIAIIMTVRPSDVGLFRRAMKAIAEKDKASFKLPLGPPPSRSPEA
jgi:hypothetical protein